MGSEKRFVCWRARFASCATWSLRWHEWFVPFSSRTPFDFWTFLCCTSSTLAAEGVGGLWGISLQGIWCKEEVEELLLFVRLWTLKCDSLIYRWISLTGRLNSYTLNSKTLKDYQVVFIWQGFPVRWIPLDQMWRSGTTSAVRRVEPFPVFGLTRPQE